MNRGVRALMIGLGLTYGGASAAEAVVREIVFEGNDTTLPETMLREMPLRPGDPADLALIERSRQAVQNLGLFREVQAQQETLGEDVRLIVRVHEKYYVIPSPRADYNSDGQYSYGLQLRWSNVWGLNHRLRGTVKYKNRQEAGRGTALVFSGGYNAPFVLGTPYSLDLAGAYSREPVEEPALYDELTSTLRLTTSRSFWRESPASESWTAGAGLQWQEQNTQGPGAPPPRGQAVALLLNGGYGWLRDNIYSEVGQSFSAEAQNASAATSSDYPYTSLTARYDGSWPLGETTHQTFGLFARGGTHHGATLTGEPPFELGGADSLRGYRHQLLRGDHFYFGGVELLRPLGWNWLRGLVFIEAGNVAGRPPAAAVTPDGRALAAGGPYADIGLGLRARLTWFVNLEFSAGLAWPLSDGGDGRAPRVFAGGYQ